MEDCEDLLVSRQLTVVAGQTLYAILSSPCAPYTIMYVCLKHKCTCTCTFMRVTVDVHVHVHVVISNYSTIM